MLGCVRAESPRRLLELAFATRAVVSLRVEPRDRDVDEALEEVPLLARGAPPFVLELFVGVEVAPHADQLESSSQAHRADYRRPRRVLVSRPWRRSCSLGTTSSSAGI